MAQSLGSLFVELKAETGAFVTGMSKASYAAKQAAKDIGQGFSQMSGAVEGALGQFGSFGAQMSAIGGQVGQFFSSFAVSGGGLGVALAGISAIGVAAIAAGAGMAAMAISGAELVERLSNISQKTGISIRDLQTFEAAGKTVGVSLEDMVTAMRKLDQGISGIGKGSAVAQMVLRGLGVTAKDNKEALLQLADAFHKMPDGVQKDADAIAVLGRSGLQLIPLLNKGRESLEEFSKMVAEYGPNVDENAKAANERWQKSTEELSLAWDRFKVNMIPVLDTIAKLVTGITVATKAMGDLIGATLKKPGNVLKDYFSAGGGIVGLATAGAMASAGNSPAGEDKQALAIAKQRSDAADVLTAKNEELYKAIKAGSSAAYALETMRAKVADAVGLSQWTIAANLEKQIPALEAAVKLEKERSAEAARLQVYIDNQKNFYDKYLGQGISKGPLFSLGRGAKLKADAAGPAPGESGVPSGTADLGTLFATPVDKMAEAAKATIADLYNEWGVDARKTADDVNDTYDEEAKKIQGFWALGLITQKTANDASVELEKARYKALEAVWAKSDTFSDQFKSLFASIGDEGRNVVKSFFDDMKSSLDELNGQLAKFIVTGKGLNLKKIGQGLEQNLASTGIKKLESMGSDALFGGAGTKKPLGTNADPIYMAFSTTASLGKLSGAGGMLGGATGAGAGSPAAIPSATAALGGLGGMLGPAGALLSPLLKLGGFFGGFLSGGGDVTPGKTYVVGEDHPEFFSPKQAGKVAPSLKFSGHAPAPVIHFSVNGVSDFDSFKRSQPQIASGLAQQLAIANSRNR